MDNFTKNHEIRECGAPIAAGATIDGNSDIIDMANWDSATFIVPITDSVDTGVAALTVEQNDANSDTGMAALEGAVATDTSEANDDLNDSLLVVEVVRPKERYIQAVRTSLTANIAFGSVIVILNGPRTKPVSEHASVLDMALAIEPEES